MCASELVDEQDRARRQAWADLEAALVHYVDVLAQQTPQRPGGESAELARVRAAHHARSELVALADRQIEHAILAARRRPPRGHSWAQIGEALGGISGQAVGKWARQHQIDTARTSLPAGGVEARAEQARQRRAQRQVTAALTAAAARWPGRRLRRVDCGDGTVMFEPDSIRVRSTAGPPVPLTLERPSHQHSDARDRALRTMAGGEVFRPLLVRRNPAPQRP